MARYIKNNVCTVLSLTLHEKISTVVTLHERRPLFSCAILKYDFVASNCAVQKVKINVKYAHVTGFCSKPPKGNIHELKL